MNGMEAASEYAAELCGLCKRFDTKQVLDNISFKVKRGEIFGLLGPSGAGKTTIINLLTGLLRPSSGSVRTSGDISVMTDCCGLYERLSVYDNLKFYAKIYRVPVRRIDTLLKKMQLYDSRKCAVMNLSKGMRGRVSLARTLLKGAPLLFLDEPTSGLDPATAKELHDLLLSERNNKTTIFLTTHNMAEAALLCDQVALLNEGKIVEQGSPRALCLKYNRLKQLSVSLTDGSLVTLPHDSASGEALKTLLEQGLVQSVHSTEPDLETVFLELTGRRFE